MNFKILYLFYLNLLKVTTFDFFQVVTRTEKDSYVVAFSDEMVPCPVTTDMTLQQVLMAMSQVRNCFY